MNFITRQCGTISFDPLSQASIDAAKAQAPGEGVGPAVAHELINKIASGEIIHLRELPDEYRKLGQICDLPG